MSMCDVVGSVCRSRRPKEILTSVEIGITKLGGPWLFKSTAILICAAVLNTLPLLAQLPLKARTDPQAGAVVKEAFTALSGTSGWANVQAAHLVGTISTPSKAGNSTSPIEWEDIWQDGKVWSLHKMGAGTSERDLIQSPGQQTMLRREDRGVVPVGAGGTRPPVEIPGAFLSMVMNDSTCTIQTVPQTTEKEKEEEDLLRITCAAPSSPGGTQSQDWAFSRSTHLPISVSIFRQDMRRAGVRYREDVYFGHYRTVNGLTIPDVCQLQQGGLRRTVNLQTIEFPNPSQFPKSDFEVSK